MVKMKYLTLDGIEYVKIEGDWWKKPENSTAFLCINYLDNYIELHRILEITQRRNKLKRILNKS